MTLRYEFEAWAKTKGYDKAGMKRKGETYRYNVPQTWWEAYQAAHAAALDAAAGVAHQAEDHYDSLGGEEYGEWIAKQIRALAEEVEDGAE